jgi:O-antigen/teichoic acid export membrane protein
VVGAATALNALVASLLVPAWGIMGAAISTGTAYGVVLLPYALTLRAAGITAFRGFGPARQLLLFIATASLLAVLAQAPVAAVPRLIVGGIIGGVAFASLALRLRLVTVPEFDAIITSLPPSFSTSVGSSFARLRPVLVFIAGRREGDV